MPMSSRHLFARDDGVSRFLEPEQAEETFGVVQVGHGDRDVVESAVRFQRSLSPMLRCSNSTGEP